MKETTMDEDNVMQSLNHASLFNAVEIASTDARQQALYGYHKCWLDSARNISMKAGWGWAFYCVWCPPAKEKKRIKLGIVVSVPRNKRQEGNCHKIVVEDVGEDGRGWEGRSSGSDEHLYENEPVLVKIVYRLLVGNSKQRGWCLLGLSRCSGWQHMRL